MTCAQWPESAFFRVQNNKMAMKKICSLLPLALAIRLVAADSPRQSEAAAGKTNVPAAGKNEAAVIPDATHQPVFTTNTIAIAGQPVAYVAETGMLPVLTATGARFGTRMEPAGGFPPRAGG